jgi:hypothetical protein
MAANWTNRECSWETTGVPQTIPPIIAPLSIAEDDDGSTQQSNTREKGEEDGTNGQPNKKTNEQMNE